MVKQRRPFNSNTFLTTAGAGRKLISFTKGQTIFAQGDTADALFVIQTGRVKVSVQSPTGTEATLDILSDADFVGKDSMAGQSFRTASACAITDCTLLRITKKVMMLALARQLKLANIFWALAEMVGTTRSRFCFFINKFKEAGFIYYGHKDQLLRVHRTLLAFLQPIALRS
jgi:signal-transduction protein with cAMP-binding, CBS, and nucleotidyltransferase domain